MYSMKKYEDLPSSSFGSICRTCLLHSDLFSIEEVNWEGINLKECILQWTSLEMSERYQLPKQMCGKCIRLMYQTNSFLTQCKRAEWALKTILLRSETEIAEEDSNAEQTENIEKERAVSTNTEEDMVHPNIEKTGTDLCKDNLEVSSADSNCSGKNDLDEEMDIDDEVILNEIRSIKSDISKLRVVNTLKYHQQMREKLMTASLKKSNTHRRKAFLGAPYKCGACENLFTSLGQLQKHRCTTCKEIEDNFRCSYCGSNFTNISELQYHIKGHTEGNLFQCETCGSSFDNYSFLTQHMIQEHPESKCYSCEHYGLEFNKKHIFDIHLRKHTNKHSDVSDIRSEGYSTDEKLPRHLKDHINVIYPCSQCDKVFVKKSSLKNHLESEHEPTVFECEPCHKRFKDQTSFLQHMQVHTGQTALNCPKCFFVCINRTQLQKHMSSHTRETIFSCAVCQEKFADKSNFINHQKTHISEKNFACNVCENIFSDFSGLKQHITEMHLS